MALPEHKITGLRGEQLVAREYVKRGYSLLSANFVSFVGEIDIIASDNKGTLCFIEVKTRSPNTLFPPSDAVDYNKQSRIISTAHTFIKAAKTEYKRVRFDIAEVLLFDINTAEINIIEDAFRSDSFKNRKTTITQYLFLFNMINFVTNS